MEELLTQNGLNIKQVFGYKVKEETNDEWFDNNLDSIIEEYQNVYPEEIRNNEDPYEYLDMSELYEWAIDYYEGGLC